MTQIFTASSLEEAKKKAAAAFGAAESEIEFEIVEEPKRSILSGLFGKKEEYRVKASYVAAVAAADEESAQPAADAAAPAAAEEITESAAPAAESVSEEIAANVPDDMLEPREETDGSDVSPEIKLEKMRTGADYLQGILNQLAPQVHCEGKLENGILFTIEGNGAGSLIGRRGETLDALQYLTSMVANRGDRAYIRVSIDTCGYREKRRKNLQELAQRISKNVLRTGRSYTLEPMNPYERRIIHSAVTEIEGVSSHSFGEEPNRKVVITSDAAPAGRQDDRSARPYRSGGGKFDRNDRQRGGRGDRRRGNDRGERRERRPAGEGPRKLDLSTSFEKDYKRPKPEDALNTGVYGKIDI